MNSAPATSALTGVAHLRPAGPLDADARSTDAKAGTVEIVTNSRDLVAVMAELHAALRPGDLAQTLSRVTDAAVELLPDVDGATIAVEHADGRFETAAATGSVDTGPKPVAGEGAEAPELAADTAARLDRVQRALKEGPAVDVTDPSGSSTEPPCGQRGPRGPSVGGTPDLGQAPAVTTSDLARDVRYPAYGAVAVRAGVRAQVAVVLFDTARARGVLNLYSHRSGAFDDTAVLTDLFAHHSATALAYAAEYQDRETTLAERRMIGQALGIVMERYQARRGQGVRAAAADRRAPRGQRAVGGPRARGPRGGSQLPRVTGGERTGSGARFRKLDDPDIRSHRAGRGSNMGRTGGRPTVRDSHVIDLAFGHRVCALESVSRPEPEMREGHPVSLDRVAPTME